MVSCCFEVESHSTNESVEVVGETLVDAIELGAPVMLETSIGSEWIEETGGQRGVDSLEEFEEDQGDGMPAIFGRRSPDRAERASQRASAAGQARCTSKRHCQVG